MWSRLVLREAGDNFDDPQFFIDNWRNEWSDSPEIQAAFPFIRDYYDVLIESLLSGDRWEAYVLEGQKVVAMACFYSFTDMHHGNCTATGLLWVSPLVRGNKQVARLLLEAQKEANARFGNRVYIRNSKVTPYITKQVARRI